MTTSHLKSCLLECLEVLPTTLTDITLPEMYKLQFFFLSANRTLLGGGGGKNTLEPYILLMKGGT